MIELTGLFVFAHGNERDIHLPAAFWILAALGLVILAHVLLPSTAVAKLRNGAASIARRIGGKKVALIVIATTFIIAGLAVAWSASTNDDEVDPAVQQQRLQVLREPPMPPSPN